MNNVLQTLMDGSTYNGSIKHSLINYALIIITVLPYLIASRQPITASKNKWHWTFITSIFVQVLLWFALGAIGVSVIWSAMAGLNLIYLIKLNSYIKGGNRFLFIVSLIAAFAGIIYYAITLPAITTAAHIIAILMGFGLFYLSGEEVKKRDIEKLSD